MIFDFSVLVRDFSIFFDIVIRNFIILLRLKIVFFRIEGLERKMVLVEELKKLEDDLKSMSICKLVGFSGKYLRVYLLNF